MAGGGALIVRGVINRLTRDLDYFGPSEVGVAPLADAFESRLAVFGYSVERVRSHPGFVRFRVSTAEGEITTVDLGWDARISPPERAGGGLVLAEAELAADKVLAVADRGEARDYVDLAALVERNGFWKAYSTALEKQPGFDPRQLFYAFSYFGDVGRDRFPIPDAAYARLTDTVDGWRRELARRVQGAGTDMRLAAVGGAPTDPAVPPRLDFRSTVDDTSRSVTNPISVSVRPHQATGSGWELAICGAAGAPLWVSDPYPTNEAAEDARGFALRVANSNYPLCIEGWDPEMPLGASYDPPSPEHAATLRVIPSPHPSGGWWLQATRPDRTVVITSSPTVTAQQPAQRRPSSVSYTCSLATPAEQAKYAQPPTPAGPETTVERQPRPDPNATGRRVVVVVLAALEGFCGVVTEMSSFLPASPERGAAASAELDIGKQPDSMGCRGSGLSRVWAWNVGRPLCVVVVLVGLVAACSDDGASVVESSSAASLPETTVTTLASASSTSSGGAAPSSATTAAAAGPTAVPGGGSPSTLRAIAPLRLDHPDDPVEFLAEISEEERSCLEESGIGLQELSQVWGGAPGGDPSERTALVIGCLQDETLLRLFLTSLVGLTDPLTPETSGCIREALASIDLHRLLSPPAQNDPVNSLGLGMAAVNVSVVCMNDEEWDVYAPRLGMRAEDRESVACLLERVGGPGALVEAMHQVSLGEAPEALVGWLEACAPQPSPPAASADDAGSGGGSMVWSFATGGWDLTGPVVVDGVVYFGADDGNLYALSAQSGELVWSFSAAAGIRSVPSVSDGTVFFGAGDNHLYALDAATGADLWRYDTGRPISYTPAVGGGLVYFAARADYDVAVHALDAATGTVVWVAEQPYPTDERLAPTAHGGRVYAQGAEYGTFYALDAATGQTIWQAEVAGYVESVPTVVDGVVYLTVFNQAHAFDEATGELIWQTNTEKFPARDFPALVTDGVYYLTPASHVHALDAATGEEIWSYQIDPEGDYGLSTAPVVAGGTLFAGSEAEHLFALDARTGKLLWTLPTENSTSHALSVVDGVLYGQASDGYLFSVDAADPNNGTIPPWFFQIGWLDDTPKYSTAGGIVYSTGPDGRFYAHTTPAPT